jgi:hypothetical protein
MNVGATLLVICQLLGHPARTRSGSNPSRLLTHQRYRSDCRRIPATAHQVIFRTCERRRHAIGDLPTPLTCANAIGIELTPPPDANAISVPPSERIHPSLTGGRYRDRDMARRWSAASTPAVPLPGWAWWRRQGAASTLPNRTLRPGTSNPCPQLRSAGEPMRPNWRRCQHGAGHREAQTVVKQRRGVSGAATSRIRLSRRAWWMVGAVNVRSAWRSRRGRSTQCCHGQRRRKLWINR